MRKISAIYEWVIAGFAALAGVLSVGMALWVTYDVMARYLLRQPTIWAVDLSEYALVWITFLAAPWVLKQRGHVRIEIFVDRLPFHLRWPLDVFTSAIGAVGCAILAWQGAVTTWDSYTRGLTMAKAWEVPQFLLYLIIPIGSLLLAVEFARYVSHHLRERRADSIVSERVEERRII